MGWKGGTVVAAFALVATTGSVSFAAPQADTGQASIQERLKRVGVDLFSGADRVHESIRELKAVLAVDPRSAEAHFLLGIAYGKLGSAELMGEATAEFRQALSLNPSFVQARYYLAQLYLNLGRAQRAREELDAALVQVPGHPQFLALLGEAERHLGHPQRSIELNQQALQVDPSFAQARYYSGLAMLDLGRRDEAIRELERVAQSGPALPEAYLSLGSAYLDAGRVDEALDALLRGNRIDPARADIRIRLARAYRSKGLLDEAEEQLKLAESAGSPRLASFVFEQMESDLYLEQGLVNMQRGRLDAAADAFKKVLDRDTNNGPANRFIAEVYLRRGLYTLALAHATRAEQLGFPLPEALRKQLQEKLHSKETRPRK